MLNIRKTTFVAATMTACALAFSAPVQAADTHAAWEGFLTFTGAPPAACAGIGGLGNGDTHVSIYRPNLGGADTSPSFLTIMFTRAALAFQSTSEGPAPQMNGAGNYNGFGINGRGKAFTWAGASGGTFNFTVTPATVMGSTNAVSITGSLTKMFNTAGCNVSFKATYAKRID